MEIDIMEIKDAFQITEGRRLYKFDNEIQFMITHTQKVDKRISSE